MRREPIDESHLREELEEIIKSGRKYEVECIHALGISYMVDVWLPAKFRRF